MYPPTAASPNVIFQSTLSMRRATRTGSDEDGQRRGISIHALHEESDSDNKASKQLQPISIHALHEESDLRVVTVERLGGISIHALHEESDPKPTSSPPKISYFNPRSP